MTRLVVDGHKRWRERASVYRAAMRKALRMLPNGSGSLLDAADHNDCVEWQDVVVFQRSHPDIMVWAPRLFAYAAPGVDIDKALDAVFRIAEAIDHGRDPTRLVAEARALLGLVEEA